MSVCIFACDMCERLEGVEKKRGLPPEFSRDRDLLDLLKKSQSSS